MERKRGNSIATLGAAAGLGALLMYALDPQQGRARVAVARDKAARWVHSGREFAESGLRDLAGRGKGVVSELGATLRNEPVSDERLAERVRAHLGRWVSHPRAIRITVVDGRVTLSGMVLGHEEHGLLHGLMALRGVRGIENRLEAHHSAEGLSQTQSGGERQGPRAEYLQSHWAPGPRLLGLLAGTALAAYGIAHRGVSGAVLGAVGAGLTTRAATNRELRKLISLRGGRDGIAIDKNIYIAAPPEAVFDLWSNPENFPRFMSRVEQVRPLDDRRSHWVVKGPAGLRFAWDSRITRLERPELIAWASEPGSPVEHAGIVRFQPAGTGTRVSVRLTYAPPAGELGHAVATLLGSDPKRDLDADLMRMKSFVETGNVPHDAALGATNADLGTLNTMPAGTGDAGRSAH
jgi:uncharacterized membrane protein